MGTIGAGLFFQSPSWHIIQLRSIAGRPDVFMQFSYASLNVRREEM